MALNLARNKIDFQGVQYFSSALSTNAVSQLLFACSTNSLLSLNTDTHNAGS
jgi:hypothetical protein